MSIREMFVDWLTSSRYVRWLESRHEEQRQLYTQWLGEKDVLIKDLRVENAGLKSECDRMRTVQNPAYAPQPKPPVVPAFSGVDDWQAELNKMYEKESADGIHEQGRELQEHESRTSDGA